MMCDIIIASENAKFGQPEVTLGVSNCLHASLFNFTPYS